MRNPLSIDYEPLRCHPGRLDRSLLTELCQCTYSSLSIFLREVVGLKDGVLGTVMRMHRVFPIGRVFLISVKETRCLLRKRVVTFGGSPEKFHPHLHVLATDYVMKDADLKALANVFHVAPM